MPNLNPVPDSYENLKQQLDIINNDAKIKVLPFGSITRGEMGLALSGIEALAPYVCGFSDDGRGVDSSSLMGEAMQRAKALGKAISAHCEDGTQEKDSPEAEYKQIERDIALCKKTGVAYHVCHISTKESVSLIRKAKAEGVNITCETAPHYLTLSDKDVRDDGRYRMNPPLRTEEDRLALLEGIKDGTIDMIATDHAPHSAEEKSRGLENSAFGIVGIETAFSAMYTHFVKTGIITLERLEELLAIAPRERFGIPLSDAGFSIWELDEKYTVNPDEFISKGRATPLEGMELYGRNMLTYHRGKVVFKLV